MKNIELTTEGREYMESVNLTSDGVNGDLKSFYFDMKDKTGMPAWEIKKAFFNALGNVDLAKSFLCN